MAQNKPAVGSSSPTAQPRDYTEQTKGVNPVMSVLYLYTYLSGWFFLLMLLIPLIGCTKKNKANNDQILSEKIPVQIGTVIRRDLNLLLECSGSLVGLEQANLYGKIPETVTKVLVKEGERVSKGQVLIHLDKEGPQSNYLQAQAVYLNAEKDYQRMENLYQQKAVSEMARDQAKTNYEVALANFRAARNLVQIASPIDGEVTEIDLVEGQQVPVGQVIAVVAQTGTLRLKFNVNTNEVKRLQPGQTIQIASPPTTGQPQRSITGHITNVSGSANPETRMFEVEAIFDNSTGLFKPGMFVQGAVKVGELKNVLTVPQVAVFVREGKTFVFTVNSASAQLVQVETGAQSDGFVQILSGLKEGEQIVTVGQNNLFDGSPVTVVNNKGKKES